jgi:hypothetical protein
MEGDDGKMRSGRKEMTTDRIMAVLALAVFAGFLAIIAIKVGRIDLGVACTIGLLLAAYDLWLQLGPGRRRG